MPNFGIRHGDFKLILPKKADSSVLDMLYNLTSDPYEMRNLLGKRAQNADAAVIGKAEHLKALLWDWMRRMDGEEKIYSDSRYNLGEGSGDMKEIRLRRTWAAVDYWQSDTSLSFGPRVQIGKKWLRNEYIYIGTTTAGRLVLESVAIIGVDAHYFTVTSNRQACQQNWWIQIKVEFASDVDVSIDDLDATVEIRTSPDRIRTVKLTEGHLL